MTTSPLGILLIQHFESFQSQAYLDSVNVPTIGWGTTRINGRTVRLGMTCTLEQANQWMRDDLRQFEWAVNQAIIEPLTEYEFSAIVSLTYNIGIAGFQSSTLYRKLRAGQKSTILRNNFTDWNKGRIDGKLVTIAGLTRRRRAEYHLFSTGTLKFEFTN